MSLQTQILKNKFYEFLKSNDFNYFVLIQKLLIVEAFTGCLDWFFSYIKKYAFEIHDLFLFFSNLS